MTLDEGVGGADEEVGSNLAETRSGVLLVVLLGPVGSHAGGVHPVLVGHLIAGVLGQRGGEVGIDLAKLVDQLARGEVVDA